MTGRSGSGRGPDTRPRSRAPGGSCGREDVLSRKLRLCVVEGRLTPAQRDELGALNARISYDSGDELCVDGRRWYSPGVEPPAVDLLGDLLRES